MSRVVEQEVDAHLLRGAGASMGNLQVRTEVENNGVEVENTSDTSVFFLPDMHLFVSEGVDKSDDLRIVRKRERV